MDSMIKSIVERHWLKNIIENIIDIESIVTISFACDIYLKIYKSEVENEIDNDHAWHTSNDIFIFLETYFAWWWSSCKIMTQPDQT